MRTTKRTLALFAVAAVMTAAMLSAGRVPAGVSTKGTGHPRVSGSTVLALSAERFAAQYARELQAEKVLRRKVNRLRQRILANEKTTRYYQRIMGVRQERLPRRQLASASVVHLRHVLMHAREVHHRVVLKAHRPPPGLSAWMCIHSGIKDGRWSLHLQYEGGGHRVGPGEGSWTDSGAPYYGGLQMNLSFMQAYGGWLLRIKGTADHWTPLEQIWTAVKARRLRGFYPWPNTARVCGLIP